MGKSVSIHLRMYWTCIDVSSLAWTVSKPQGQDQEAAREERGIGWQWQRCHIDTECGRWVASTRVRHARTTQESTNVDSIHVATNSPLLIVLHRLPIRRDVLALPAGGAAVLHALHRIAFPSAVAPPFARRLAAGRHARPPPTRISIRVRAGNSHDAEVPTQAVERDGLASDECDFPPSLAQLARPASLLVDATSIPPLYSPPSRR